MTDAEKMVDAVRRFVERSQKPLLDRIKELEENQLRVVGGFRSGNSYRKGDGVQFDGSFYIATKSGRLCQPGDGDDWFLAAKKGRDGKDLTR